MFQKSPKTYDSKFYLKVMTFNLAQKVTKYLEYFWKQICWQENRPIWSHLWRESESDKSDIQREKERERDEWHLEEDRQRKVKIKVKYWTVVQE